MLNHFYTKQSFQNCTTNWQRVKQGVDFNSLLITFNKSTANIDLKNLSIILCFVFFIKNYECEIVFISSFVKSLDTFPKQNIQERMLLRSLILQICVLSEYR